MGCFVERRSLLKLFLCSVAIPSALLTGCSGDDPPNWQYIPDNELPDDIPERFKPIIQKAAQYAYSFQLQGQHEKVDLVSGMLRGVIDFYSEFKDSPVSAEDAFDLLMLKAQIESKFGKHDVPYNSTNDSTGVPQIYGPYHFAKIMFARLLGRYGPGNLRNEIEITQNGAIIKGYQDDPEKRKRILALRNDPYIASRVSCGHMMEAAIGLKNGWERMKKEYAGRDFPDIEINQTNMYIEHVLGMQDDKPIKVIEAANEDGIFHNVLGHTIMPDVAEHNPSLFEGAFSWLPLGEVYQQFKDRVDDRKKQLQSELERGLDENTPIPVSILDELFPTNTYDQAQSSVRASLECYIMEICPPERNSLEAMI